MTNSSIGCGEADPALGAVQGVKSTPTTHHPPACADGRNSLADNFIYEQAVTTERSELRGVM